MAMPPQYPTGYAMGGQQPQFSPQMPPTGAFAQQQHPAPYQSQMEYFPQQVASPQGQFYYPQQGTFNGQAVVMQQPGMTQQPMMGGAQPMMIPQQPMMMQNQPMMGQQQPIMVQQPIIIQQQKMPNVKLGAKPKSMICPSCQGQITSRVDVESTSTTHMTACFLCLIGAPCCLCVIPYCMNSMKCRRHSCPICGHELGKFNKTSKNACMGVGFLAALCLICDACGDDDDDDEDYDEHHRRDENGEVEGKNGEIKEGEEENGKEEKAETPDEPEAESSESTDDDD